MCKAITSQENQEVSGNLASFRENILLGKVVIADFTFGGASVLVASCMHVYYTVICDVGNSNLR